VSGPMARSFADSMWHFAAGDVVDTAGPVREIPRDEPLNRPGAADTIEQGR